MTSKILELKRFTFLGFRSKGARNMDIIEEYKKLKNSPNHANIQWYRNRGFEFERLIKVS